MAANFTELLHNSPAPRDFIGNNYDNKLVCLPASTHLLYLAQPACRQDPLFPPLWGTPERSFCPGCCRVWVHSQVNPTSCLFNHGPMSFLKPFYWFFFEDELESLWIALSRQASSTLRGVDPNSNPDIHLLSVWQPAGRTDRKHKTTAGQLTYSPSLSNTSGFPPEFKGEWTDPVFNEKQKSRPNAV